MTEPQDQDQDQTTPTPAPPIQSTAEGSYIPPKKRPVLVTIIFVLAVLGFSLATIGYLMIFAGAEATKDLDIGPLELVFGAATTCVGFWSALLLFKLREDAVKFYMIFFALNTVSIIIGIVMRGDTQGIIGALVLAGICYYAIRLKQAGILT